MKWLINLFKKKKKPETSKKLSYTQNVTQKLQKTIPDDYFAKKNQKDKDEREDRRRKIRGEEYFSSSYETFKDEYIPIPTEPTNSNNKSDTSEFEGFGGGSGGGGGASVEWGDESTSSDSSDYGLDSSDSGGSDSND